MWRGAGRLTSGVAVLTGRRLTVERALHLSDGAARRHERGGGRAHGLSGGQPAPVSMWMEPEGRFHAYARPPARVAAVQRSNRERRVARGRHRQKGSRPPYPCSAPTRRRRGRGRSLAARGRMALACTATARVWTGSLGSLEDPAATTAPRGRVVGRAGRRAAGGAGWPAVQLPGAECRRAAPCAAAQIPRHAAVCAPCGCSGLAVMQP